MMRVPAVVLAWGAAFFGTKGDGPARRRASWPCQGGLAAAGLGGEAGRESNGLYAYPFDTGDSCGSVWSWRLVIGDRGTGERTGDLRVVIAA
jgi:hypothetical protein